MGAGPNANFSTEYNNSWRQHVEDDPSGRAGRGPAASRRPPRSSRSRRRRKRSPRRRPPARQRRRRPPPQPAAPAAGRAGAKADRRPSSSTIRTASKRCGRAATSSPRSRWRSSCIMSMGSWYIIITKVYEQCEDGHAGARRRQVVLEGAVGAPGRRRAQEGQPVPLHRRIRPRGDAASTSACSATST